MWMRVLLGGKPPHPKGRCPNFWDAPYNCSHDLTCTTKFSMITHEEGVLRVSHATAYCINAWRGLSAIAELLVFVGMRLRASKTCLPARRTSIVEERWPREISVELKSLEATEAGISVSLCKWPCHWLVPSPAAIWPNAFVESRGHHEEAAFVNLVSLL